MLLTAQKVWIGSSISFMTSIQLVLVSQMRVSSSDKILSIHRVLYRSLNLITSLSGDTSLSTTVFCTFWGRRVFLLPFFCLLFDLETIDRSVVERVGGEGWTLEFGVHGFAGGFGATDGCFSTTFALFDAGFFPIVFAALESAFLPTADLLEGGCGGWVEDWRFVAARSRVDVSASTGSARRFGGTPRVDRVGLPVSCTGVESLHCTRLIRRIDRSVVDAEGGGADSSESASGAVEALVAVLFTTEASGCASTFKSVCAAAEVDILTLII
jgi:hypothetical protein